MAPSILETEFQIDDSQKNKMKIYVIGNKSNVFDRTLLCQYTNFLQDDIYDIEIDNLEFIEVRTNLPSDAEYVLCPSEDFYFSGFLAKELNEIKNLKKVFIIYIPFNGRSLIENKDEKFYNFMKDEYFQSYARISCNWLDKVVFLSSALIYPRKENYPNKSEKQLTEMEDEIDIDKIMKKADEDIHNFYVTFFLTSENRDRLVSELNKYL